MIFGIDSKLKSRPGYHLLQHPINGKPKQSVCIVLLFWNVCNVFFFFILYCAAVCYIFMCCVSDHLANKLQQLCWLDLQMMKNFHIWEDKRTQEWIWWTWLLVWVRHKLPMTCWFCNLNSGTTISRAYRKWLTQESILTGSSGVDKHLLNVWGQRSEWADMLVIVNSWQSNHASDTSVVSLMSVSNDCVCIKRPYAI